MTPSKQLPLDAPRKTGDSYRMIQVTAREEKNPSKRGHVALGVYTGRFAHKPREIICHPLDAAEIGPEVMGIPVISTGLSRFVFLVGPMEV